ARNPSDQRLQHQIALLDAASISTIDAFCRRLLARFFAAADLDPAFHVLDQHDAKMLFRETVDDLVRSIRRTETPLTAPFEALVAEIGRGRDDGIVELLTALHQFLNSISDPDRWLNESAARFSGGTRDQLSPDWAERRRRALADELAAQANSVRSDPPV